MPLELGPPTHHGGKSSAVVACQKWVPAILISSPSPPCQEKPCLLSSVTHTPGMQSTVTYCEALLPYVGCALGIGALLGQTAMWDLWEQDIFWQLRAGKEIWQTWRLQTVDTWTYTVQGHEWHNYCWLSSVIFYALAPEATDAHAIAHQFVLYRVCV